MNDFPRSQHWSVDGFRVGVLLYKSHRRDQCAVCGQRGAIHSVYAERAADGFSGGPSDFCDTHRPAKGTLPALDYQRVIHDGHGTSAWTRTTERLIPDPSWPCNTCGQPSTVRRETLCGQCTDPEHHAVSTVRVLTLDGTHTETRTDHKPHLLTAANHCPEHRP